MIDVLSAPGLSELRRFAATDVLLGLDYDGTLAPIQYDRDNVRLRDEMRDLLRAAASRYTTVLISGRARDDLARLVGDVPGLEYVGNHGAESPGETPGEIEQQVGDWRTKLEARLRHVPDIAIEDKRLSLSVHYRNSRPWTVARSVILDAAQDLEGARVLGGKAVVNVVPAAAPHKGDALQRACNKRHKTHAIYVGDDETDEDVFRIADPARVFTIRVGYRAESAAGYFLHEQRMMDELLGLLVSYRSDAAAAARVRDPTAG